MGESWARAPGKVFDKNTVKLVGGGGEIGMKTTVIPPPVQTHATRRMRALVRAMVAAPVALIPLLALIFVKQP